MSSVLGHSRWAGFVFVAPPEVLALSDVALHTKWSRLAAAAVPVVELTAPRLRRHSTVRTA
jgi:hypothetical protein